MKLILALALCFVTLPLSPAHAEHETPPDAQDYLAASYILATPLLNIGLAGYDLWPKKTTSKKYGVIEAALTIPQALLGGYVFYGMWAPQSEGGNLSGGEWMVGAVYFALPTALAVHGILAAVSDSQERSEEQGPPGLQARVMVAPISVAQESGMGLNVLGTF